MKFLSGSGKYCYLFEELSNDEFYCDQWTVDTFEVNEDFTVKKLGVDSLSDYQKNRYVQLILQGGGRQLPEV